MSEESRPHVVKSHDIGLDSDYVSWVHDVKCQTAHCGRYIPHFDFGAKPSPIVPYRHLPQSLSGMTADCRSLV